MRVLFDTNILLDLFLDRLPFADEAAALWQANADGRITGYVSAITPVNLYYIARRLRNREVARQALAELLAALSVCPVDQSTSEEALSLPFTDYEDAVQHASAVSSGLVAIITRNEKDFAGATVSVLSPADFLDQLSKSPEE